MICSVPNHTHPTANKPEEPRMTWFADLVPPPHTRRPLNLHSFSQDLLPPIVCYYATAVLVLLPETLSVRLALLPLTLWFAFRAATRLDLALGYDDERLIYLNQGLLLVMTTLGMRVIVWSFQRKPYRRVGVASKVQPSEGDVPAAILSPGKIVADAFDLCCNLRGCGWNWSRGLQVPPETRSTDSTIAFTTATFTSLILHFVFFDILHYSVRWFAPTTVGSAKGGTIFDPTIPPVPRYLRSSTMTFLSGLTVYCAIQMGYHITTLFGVLMFRQHLSLWPPAFRAPWSSMSLSEYWAKRWHQMFRHNFVSLGAEPLSWLAGRAGGVLGAFLVSGVLHDFGLWGMGNGSDFQSVGGFFLMMGIGVILENLWKTFSGRGLGGWPGRIWAILWVIGWGNILVDAWGRKGLIGSVFFPRYMRPTEYIFGPLP